MKDKKVIKETEEEEEDEQGDDEEEGTAGSGVGKDFNHRPLHIQKSGLYIFTEDGTFDFGAENECYFEGITIEADDVIIDSGGYELEQGIEFCIYFYFPQRLFIHIGLSSGQTLPRLGSGFFGADPVFINDFESHNGILGRLSHSGICGNYPNRFVLKDNHIHHFGTPGMQLIGWKNVEMVPYFTTTTGKYTIYDGVADTPIGISNGYNSISKYQILSRLEYEELLAFDYAINRYDNRCNNEYSDIDYKLCDLLENVSNNDNWGEIIIVDIVYKLSLDIDSRFCICYKLNENDVDDYLLTMKDNKVIKKKAKEEEEEDEEEEEQVEDRQEEKTIGGNDG